MNSPSEPLPSLVLALLRCPLTGRTLQPATQALIADCNVRIARGEIDNRGGVAVNAPLDGGLIDAQSQWLFPIRQGIVTMVADEAIPLQ